MTDLVRSQPSAGNAAVIGTAAVLGSLATMNLGAAVAKLLFPLVGAYGVTAIRLCIAALILAAMRRPWRRPLPRAVLPALLGYGAGLGLMNLLIYQAFARLPIGIATGIEVLGPLAVVLWGSRTPRDLVWFALAVAGLLLLLPLRSGALLDVSGIAFASGAAVCWALYIVYGKRVSGVLGSDAVAWGMPIAAIVAAPLGIVSAGPALFDPWVLAVGCGVAVLSSAIPYTLEMEAMRRLPSHVLGILLSTAPAVAAIAGIFVLGEVLSGLQWFAILCIAVAAAGSAGTSARRS